MFKPHVPCRDGSYLIKKSFNILLDPLLCGSSSHCYQFNIQLQTIPETYCGDKVDSASQVIMLVSVRKLEQVQLIDFFRASCSDSTTDEVRSFQEVDTVTLAEEAAVSVAMKVKVDSSQQLSFSIIGPQRAFVRVYLRHTQRWHLKTTVGPHDDVRSFLFNISERTRTGLFSQLKLWHQCHKASCESQHSVKITPLASNTSYCNEKMARELQRTTLLFCSDMSEACGGIHTRLCSFRPSLWSVSAEHVPQITPSGSLSVIQHNGPPLEDILGHYCSKRPIDPEEASEFDFEEIVWTPEDGGSPLTVAAIFHRGQIDDAELADEFVSLQSGARVSLLVKMMDHAKRADRFYLDTRNHVEDVLDQNQRESLFLSAKEEEMREKIDLWVQYTFGNNLQDTKKKATEFYKSNGLVTLSQKKKGKISTKPIRTFTTTREEHAKEIVITSRYCDRYLFKGLFPEGYLRIDTSEQFFFQSIIDCLHSDLELQKFTEIFRLQRNVSTILTLLRSTRQKDSALRRILSLCLFSLDLDILHRDLPLWLSAIKQLSPSQESIDVCRRLLSSGSIREFSTINALSTFVHERILLDGLIADHAVDIPHALYAERQAHRIPEDDFSVEFLGQRIQLGCRLRVLSKGILEYTRAHETFSLNFNEPTNTLPSYDDMDMDDEDEYDEMGGTRESEEESTLQVTEGAVLWEDFRGKLTREAPMNRQMIAASMIHLLWNANREVALPWSLLKIACDDFSMNLLTLMIVRDLTQGDDVNGVNDWWYNLWTVDIIQQRDQQSLYPLISERWLRVSASILQCMKENNTAELDELMSREENRGDFAEMVARSPKFSPTFMFLKKHCDHTVRLLSHYPIYNEKLSSLGIQIIKIYNLRKVAMSYAEALHVAKVTGVPECEVKNFEGDTVFLEKWRAVQKSKRQINVRLKRVADCTDLILIEGHSLIYHILHHSPSLKWSPTCGGVHLQAVYALEKLMDELLREGAQIHIVWFTIHRLAWKDNPSGLFFCDIMKRYLDVVARGSDWEAYCTDNQPVYYGTDSHQSLLAETSVTLMSRHNMIPFDIRGISMENSRYFFDARENRKAETSRRLRELHDTVNIPGINSEFSSLNSSFLSATQIFPELNLLDLQRAWDTVSPWLSLPKELRRKGAVTTVAVMMNMHTETIDLRTACQCVVASIVIQELLPIQHRPLQLALPPLQEFPMVSFLKKFQLVCLYGYERGHLRVESGEEMIDWLDVRLALNLWSWTLSKAVDVSEIIHDETGDSRRLFQEIWRGVQNASSVRGKQEEFHVAENETSLWAQLQPTNEIRTERHTLQEFHHPGLTDYLNQVSKFLEKSGIQVKQSRGKFKEAYHWHSSRSIMEDEAMATRKDIRQHQRSDLYKTTETLRVHAITIGDPQSQIRGRDARRASTLQFSLKTLREYAKLYQECSRTQGPFNALDKRFRTSRIDTTIEQTWGELYKCMSAKYSTLYEMLKTGEKVDGIWHAVNDCIREWRFLCSNSNNSILMMNVIVSVLQRCSAWDVAKNIIEGYRKLGSTYQFRGQYAPGQGGISHRNTDLTVSQLSVHGKAIAWSDASDLNLSLTGRNDRVGEEYEERIGFRPDVWQRELLEAFRRRESCLVMAPTSSGKTFIAYEIARSTLESGDDSLMVYVCPIKALAEQVYMELSTRFVKKYQDQNRTMLGIFTSEQRLNVSSCQILVTLPECLEIFLLSPPQVQWRERLRTGYTVHLLSEESRGPVWEHVLALLPSPFFALSATMGDSQLFQSWLLNFAPNLRVIVSEERATDLRFNTIKLGDGSTKIQSINPLALIPHVEDVPRLLSSIPLLLPDQVYQLWLLMKRNLGAFESRLYNELNPHVLFSGVFPIHRRQIFQLEQNLRSTLSRLCDRAFDPSGQQLRMPLQMLWKDLQTPLRMNLSNRVPGGGYAYIRKHFLEMYRGLVSHKMMPALMFTMSTSFCDELLRILVTDLEGKPDDEEVEMQESRRQISEELTKLSVFARRKKDGIEDLMIRGILCGVGLHYARAPQEYKLRILKMFVERKLRFVIATGTLAFGLNMPAKTVVIGPHNLHLTPSVFRQIAGRAGRRGYDTYGDVITIGIEKPIVERMVTSRLPPIYGRMPFNCAFVMRLMILIDQCRHPSTDAAVSRLLNTPFFTQGNTSLVEVVKHHFRFTIELLMRMEVLDNRGKALSEAGFVSHLSYTESSVLLFVWCLRHGDFPFGKRTEAKVLQNKGDRDIMEILCALFGEQMTDAVGTDVLPPNEPIERLMEAATMGCSPMPILRNMAKMTHFEKLESAKEEYNRMVKQVFDSYMSSYTANFSSVTIKAPVLPLSSHSFSTNPAYTPITPSADRQGICNLLSSQKLNFSARTVFSALGGRDDSFESSTDLAFNFRPDVVFDPSSIPLYEKKFQKTSSFLVDMHSNPWLPLNAVAQLFGLSHVQVDIIKAAENFHGLLLKLRTVLFQIVSDNYKYKPLLSSINRLCSFWQKRVSNLTASIPSQLQDLNLQLNTMAYSVEADDEEPAKKTAKVNKKNDRKGIQSTQLTRSFFSPVGPLYCDRCGVHGHLDNSATSSLLFEFLIEMSDAAFQWKTEVEYVMGSRSIPLSLLRMNRGHSSHIIFVSAGIYNGAMDEEVYTRHSMEYGSFLPVLTRWDRKIDTTVTTSEIFREPEVLVALMKGRSCVVFVVVGRSMTEAAQAVIPEVLALLDDSSKPTVQFVSLEKVPQEGEEKGKRVVYDDVGDAMVVEEFNENLMETTKPEKEKNLITYSLPDNGDFDEIRKKMDDLSTDILENIKSKTKKFSYTKSTPLSFGLPTTSVPSAAQERKTNGKKEYQDHRRVREEKTKKRGADERRKKLEDKSKPLSPLSRPFVAREPFVPRDIRSQGKEETTE
ncbi:hypothetical protein PROFUN_03973 [Planoprotostelium fungivorum]|uniref:Helicase ATP-binding domain-containing protein n=1 Tax=Planoprotostelium fungivorum TaxID=1890364 RepID=A0A2P6NW18_9EUKA|nr:hypothetical protein PROFUN_03973 [Planoprotostelium fungivorum]